jgi:hypothetical protein
MLRESRPPGAPMSLRLTDTHEERVLWRELQLAASASAGVYKGAEFVTVRISKKMDGEFSAVL